ncbi:MAG: protein translocase subunit SecF [Candidatus Nanohaloarchaea archaeon]|nr:protein translocase subunit SecF [Candidatus Nanohaloarchaea archaeon]
MNQYSVRDVFDTAYEHPRRALLVPALMFLAAAGVLLASYATDGAALEKGIDFTGGTEVHIPVTGDVSPGAVEAAFGGEASARTMSGGGTQWVIVETKQTYNQDGVARLLSDAGIPFDQDTGLSIRTLGAAVGSAFFREAQLAAAAALLIMSIVIFVAFRSIVPSLAVILAAVTDMLVALAGMAVLGIDLTLGSLAALLMLLGYSVDTDILLSTRVLKQSKGDLADRIWSSVATGSTMTIAAIAAFAVLFVVSPSSTLDQIAAVIVIGLAADLPITWLGNAFILKWHVERDGV